MKGGAATSEQDHNNSQPPAWRYYNVTVPALLHADSLAGLVGMTSLVQPCMEHLTRVAIECIVFESTFQNLFIF